MKAFEPKALLSTGLIVVFCLFVSGCASTAKSSATLSSAPLQHETLLQPPLPEGQWNVAKGKPPGINMLEVRWTSKTSKDMAKTFVIYGESKADVNKLKTMEEQNGSKECDQLFKTQVLASGKQNAYSQLTWQTHCKNSKGMDRLMLNKVISGNESMYVFQRFFYSPPSIKTWKTWVNYVNRISVCDGSRKQHACPKGAGSNSN